MLQRNEFLILVENPLYFVELDMVSHTILFLYILDKALEVFSFRFLF
jgi:hypothetical protein